MCWSRNSPYCDERYRHVQAEQQRLQHMQQQQHLHLQHLQQQYYQRWYLQAQHQVSQLVPSPPCSACNKQGLTGPDLKLSTTICWPCMLLKAVVPSCQSLRAEKSDQGSDQGLVS